jgi:cation diffusion facilitator CzcD-associated flavoprotein CzcO
MPGDMPWPEVKVGNANHADTAVLIVGAGISGICTAIVARQQVSGLLL